MIRQSKTDANSPTPRLPGIVWATSCVSYLTDLSTELIYAILPAFYQATLGLGALWLGLIEGFAEAVASLTKLFSGYLSDRTGGRKWWMMVGYSLSTLSRPVLPLAGGGWTVLAMRGADRMGKGIRGAPRDAILSREVPASMRGRAYGVQRAMDHAGALSGTMLASVLLFTGTVSLRGLFWLTLIPGGIAVLVILLFVHEQAQPESSVQQPGGARGPASFLHAIRDQSPVMRRYLMVLAVFSLGNSTDALLLARAMQQLQSGAMTTAAAAAMLPLLWGWLHVIKSASSPWGGSLSDRLGRVRPVVYGWLLYAAVYVGFALWSSWAAPWLLFGVYGIYYGLVEGAEKALVADLESDASKRGTAFGLYHFVVGLAALPASALCGWLWQWGDRALYSGAGSALAFGLGALLALAAAGLLPWALCTPARLPVTAGD